MDRNDRTAELLATLNEGIAALTTTKAWTSWLDTQRRFHRYSFGNALLIGMQRPDATQVAGFHAWKKLGRSVRKGEHGIHILAPVTRRLEADDKYDEVEEKAARHLVGFRGAVVFDPLSRVSHTALTSRAIVRDRHLCDCRPGWEAKAFIAEVG